MQQAHLAPYGFEKELKHELDRQNISYKNLNERLFIADQSDQLPCFAQVSWLNLESFNFNSINEAAQRLKSIQRNWSLYSINHHRRAKLIEDKLPFIKQKPKEFLFKSPTQPMGAWTLENEKTIFYSKDTTSVMPLGEWNFIEDKINPPSRAYLKLWEFFTRFNTYPLPHEKVIDLGSCPGGWTWVLSQLSDHVLSVDKAPLDQKLMNDPKIKFMQESAFGIDPLKIGPVDWLFSDIICYPEKLYDLVISWLNKDAARNFVCTLKFQAETDFSTIDKFRQIPGSNLTHLFCNKHELTWSLIR